jgi:hypothetical protein
MTVKEIVQESDSEEETELPAKKKLYGLSADR